MHQHLVDDHLEEQRRDQCEQLQKEGGDQHLAQEMAIFVDRSQKPGDVETAGDVRQSRSAGHQDQAAVPQRDEVRRASSRSVAASLAIEPEPCPRRPWQPPESRRRAAWRSQARVSLQAGASRPGRPRLESEILGAPEHFRCANLVCTQPMPDLFTIRRYALQMQQRHERFEPRIGGYRCQRSRTFSGCLHQA